LTANLTPDSPQQAIAALLEQYAPQRILVVGRSELPVLTAFCQMHPQIGVEHAPQPPLPAAMAAQRYDLAIIANCLEHLTKRDGMQLLGGIRNLNASRIAVLVELARCDWQATEFYSLGLQLHAQYEKDGRTLSLFTYDLLVYKHVPDWLNAKFWANPQMFGKYWW
jgi:DNA-binding transcriptional LysR family regulator